MRKILLAAVLALLLAVTPAMAEKFGVYVQVVEKAEGSFDEIVSRSEKALGDAGWQVIASNEADVGEKCDGLRGHTIVLHNAAYARKVLAKGGVFAAFALPPRVGVYQDEEGTHVAFLNPSSINRTFVGDDTLDEISGSAAEELSAILAPAAGGTVVNRQIGQIRKKGYVGGMGGGKFKKKVEILHEEPAADGALAAVAARVKEGVKAYGNDWKLIYHLDCVPQGVVVFGVLQGATEAKAYQIAGAKRKKKSLKCPGIDHAAAFPIEIVVMQDGDKVKVAILDEMYRMKVFFQDAGMLAFARNMTMPDKIEKEIRKMSLLKLK